LPSTIRRFRRLPQPRCRACGTRAEFIHGRAATTTVLARKQARERDCRLVKDRWPFNNHGLRLERHASINVPVDLRSRTSLQLAATPPGRRTDCHPGLSALGL